jgi:hypothetical protein
MANPTPYSAHNKIANGTIVDLGRNGVDSKAITDFQSSGCAETSTLSCFVFPLFS